MIKSFLDIYKSLVDKEIIYNLSSLENYDYLHLLISDWIKIALIHVSHPHVILFILLVGFIYFGMHVLSGVFQIHTFPPRVLAPKKPYVEIGNIISLCSSSTDIWSRYFCFFKRLPLIFTNNESGTLGYCITWGWFSIQSCSS